jgi:hypothetical protein
LVILNLNGCKFWDVTYETTNLGSPILFLMSFTAFFLSPISHDGPLHPGNDCRWCIPRASEWLTRVSTNYYPSPHHLPVFCFEIFLAFFYTFVCVFCCFVLFEFLVDISCSVLSSTSFTTWSS